MYKIAFFQYFHKEMPGAIRLISAKDIPESGKNNFESLAGFEPEPVSC